MTCLGIMKLMKGGERKKPSFEALDVDRLEGFDRSDLPPNQYRDQTNN